MVNKMATGSFEKPQHISGELSGHVYVQGCVHAEKRPGRALIPHLWVTWASAQAVSKG